MDKTQLKLVELSENITALEICLNNGLMDFSDLILYLQYDILLLLDFLAYLLLLSLHYLNNQMLLLPSLTLLVVLLLMNK